LRPPPKLRLPSAPRWPAIAIAASVLVHSLLLFGWIEGRVPVLPHRRGTLIVLLPPAEGPQEVTMPFRIPHPIGPEGSGTVGARPDRPALPQRRVQAVAALPEPEPRPARLRVDTGSTSEARRRAAIGMIGPGLAQGRLWVRPLPLPPKELAERLSKKHVELVDSAVTAIVQAYLDSIAADPASRNAALPSWTKEIAGRKFGIDSKNIYVAGLKIPAAVLALLPIPAGNIDQNRAYNHLMDMRADLQYAAQRSANMEEFKETIREIRRRKEREEEFQRNQRTAPPPDTAATP
jgi:hypothetical protein